MQLLICSATEVNKFKAGILSVFALLNKNSPKKSIETTVFFLKLTSDKATEQYTSQKIIFQESKIIAKPETFMLQQESTSKGENVTTTVSGMQIDHEAKT